MKKTVLNQQINQQVRPDDLLAMVAASVQSDFDAEVLAEAAEIADIERSRQRLLDRWRGTCGQVTVKMPGLSPVIGEVRVAGTECALIVCDSGSSWVVSLPRLTWVAGLADSLRDENSSNRTALDSTWSQLMREWEGALLRCHLAEGLPLTGVLHQVGADHLDLELGAHPGRVVIGFSALLAVERPGRMGGIERNPEFPDTSWR